jgi:hypothetical protein
MKGLWTKCGFAAPTTSSSTAAADASGSGCPNERDVKTSSRVA